MISLSSLEPFSYWRLSGPKPLQRGFSGMLMQHKVIIDAELDLWKGRRSSCEEVHCLRLPGLRQRANYHACRREEISE